MIRDQSFNFIQDKRGTSTVTTIIIIFVVSLLFAGASGGTTFYLLDQQFKIQKQDLQDQIDELTKDKEDIKKELEATKEKLAEKSETADWKSYTNSKYSYSIKYPMDYRCEATNDNPLKCWPNDYTVHLRTVDSYSKIQVAVYTGEVPDYKKYTAENFEEYEKGSTKFTKVKDKDDVYIKKGSTTYRIFIEMEDREHPTDFTDIFKTMLSTFKLN